ncbi:alpha/beta hydrolase [Ammoniphilus sp. CFH 90114]|uniref:alpha/beta hydrolase n=1 Tax=Ammoniphilus sp. CFH 90114 TaxID=2493665 RepID=UPI00100E888D|nr:alpha/beta hydrolase [Ammoniphilus sp. CFH 90114]RXT06481.1 alpha/beta hydrolase [Ammoniphilus sp. CFH 90114]
MKRDIQVLRNLVFGQTDKEYLTADVYRPLEGENFPAILLIHGGAFQSGSKEMYREWGHYLAREGMVAVAINYRLATPSNPIWPDVLSDVRQAINWIVSKSHEWNIEPLRIGVVGDSAGATLASLLAFHSHVSSYKIRAVVGVYGLYDMLDLRSSREETIIKRLVGQNLKDAPEVYREVSPINYVEKIVESPIFDTSFFLVWGEQDQVVHPSQSIHFASRLKEAGVPVSTLIFPKHGHFWFNLLPGIDGGSLHDYPNTKAAPAVLEYLKKELIETELGNFSSAQISRLKELV